MQRRHHARPRRGAAQQVDPFQPEQHGVVLTGWTAAIGGDGPVLAGLTDTMLRSREPRQSRFMHAAQELSPGKQLTEYDLLLQHLYGRRRFRPFTVSTGTNN